FFNKTPVFNGQPEPGGLADEIDPRNLNLSTTVAVDVNGFLGNNPGQLPPTSDNVIALSATIGAHEVGHTAGLIHPDSQGPIGFGDHISPFFHYLPSYPGPGAAWETPLHLMASPASVNTTLQDAADNPFFGEREAVKLAFIEGGTVVSE